MTSPSAAGWCGAQKERERARDINNKQDGEVDEMVNKMKTDILL